MDWAFPPDMHTCPLDHSDEDYNVKLYAYLNSLTRVYSKYSNTLNVPTKKINKQKTKYTQSPVLDRLLSLY